MLLLLRWLLVALGQESSVTITIIPTMDTMATMNQGYGYVYSLYFPIKLEYIFLTFFHETSVTIWFIIDCYHLRTLLINLYDSLDIIFYVPGTPSVPVAFLVLRFSDYFVIILRMPTTQNLQSKNC